MTPSELRQLPKSTHGIIIELAAVKRRNLKLQEHIVELEHAVSRLKCSLDNHDPFWPYEVIVMLQEDFPDIAPMFFNDHFRALKAENARLKVLLSNSPVTDTKA